MSPAHIRYLVIIMTYQGLNRKFAFGYVLERCRPGEVAYVCSVKQGIKPSMKVKRTILQFKLNEGVIGFLR